MKFHFTSEEMQLLNELMGRLSPLAAHYKDYDDGKLMRAVNKMKYKFTPNASVVYLNRRERDLLASLATTGIGLSTIRPDHAALLQTIRDKVNQELSRASSEVA